MRTVKSKHKNEFSYSIADFIKTKNEKARISNNKPKIASYSKCALNNSKSQCRKVSMGEKTAVSTTVLYSTNENPTLQKVSENEQFANTIKRNRTMTNMIVHQPKGDNDEALGIASKNESNDRSSSPKLINAIDPGKENQEYNYSMVASEIKSIKSSSKLINDKCNEAYQLIGKRFPPTNPIAAILKDVIFLYDEKYRATNAQAKCLNEKIANIETAFRNKQAELDSERSKFLKEIKLQQNHIDAQAVVISQLQETNKQSEILKAKYARLSEEHNNHSISFAEKPFKKSAVPSLDLSKLKKKEGQLSLIVKPSLYHHSLSSDSGEEEDSNEKANKTTIAIPEHTDTPADKKNLKVPKLNLYYLKKSM